MTERFLGRGWKFPVRVNNRGGLSYSGGVEDIEEAIWIILGTSKGERLMLPDFGCGIHDIVFEPLNPTTIGDIEYQVNEALLKWESRIEVLGVNVEQGKKDRSLLLIRVDYKIMANNNFYNIVYPFYFKEGAGSQ